MSAELMKKAFEIAKGDKRLTPADKLVLMRWAWTTREGCQPTQIPIRGFARELGLNKSTVERSIQRLKACGYIVVEAVLVVAGPMFQLSAESGHLAADEVSAKSGQGVRKKRTKRPQKADTNKKDIKKGPAALSLNDLGRYSLSALRAGNPVVLSNGRQIKPGEPQYAALSELLRQSESQ